MILPIISLVLIAFWAPAYATDQSGKPTWELVYLSPYGGCTNYQYQMADVYDEEAAKYLQLYKFDNSHYPVQCMSDKKYSNYSPPQDLNLLILVYDNEIGKNELHLNDIGGLYSHAGSDRTKNHIIIICDCSNFGYSDPTWTLSHELSHFVIYYLGFDFTAQNQVHEMSKQYNECVEGHSKNSCSTTTISGDHYFSNASVLPPYQPAVGKKLVPENNDTNASASSEVVIDMQKEITKWWLEGKIDDTEYTKVLQIAYKQPAMSQNGMLPDNVLLAAGPDGKEENSTYHDLSAGEDKKTASILKRDPFKIENTTNSKFQIPQWFKSTAQGWSKGFLNNQNFTDSIKYFLGVKDWK